MNVEQVLSLSPVIPIVTIRDSDHAVSLAEALLDGGVPVIEVTLRTQAALEAIERIVEQVAGITVLAGTVCSATQVRESVAAGAAGLVSPGLTASIAEAVTDARIAWLPGIATASDILLGLELGLAHFKLFPANVAGGPAALRAFAGPFPGIRFCPTGGIDREAAAAYLALPNVACVGGSWVAPDDLIRSGNWSAIRDHARHARGLERAG